MRYHSRSYGLSGFRMCVAVFLLIEAVVAQSHAGPALVVDAGRQFGYAEDCFAKNEFLTAISEYRRFVYFFPDDDRAEDAMHKIGMAYFLNGNYREALTVFKQNTEAIKDEALTTQSWLMISKCHLMMEEYAPAIISLNNLATLTGKTDIRDEAYYRAGWVCLEDLNDPESFERSNAYFSKISRENRDRYNVDEICDALTKEDRIPAKNPDLAAIISVVPGAGYAYCGRYKDGAVAFLVNSALMLAAYEAFDEDMEALGAVISCVETGFYMGNIYGAKTSAWKYNRKQKKKYIENMKQTSGVSLSACPRNEGMMISLNVAF